MNCPRCEGPLDERVRDGVTIDVCARCRGIWLDRGELEKLIAIATADDASLAEDERPGRRRDERFFPPSDDERMAGRRRLDDSDAHRLPGGPERRWREDSDAHRMPAGPGGVRRKRRWYESIGDLFD